MTQQRIFIFGASGHGLVTMEAAVAQGHVVVGWIDSFKPAGSKVAGLAILGTPDQLPELMTKHQASVGILAISDNWIRSEVAAKIRGAMPGFEFVNVVHPRAWVSPSTHLGSGVLVLAGAVINAACTVGDHCIVNTKASLDHDSEMKPYSSILPGVTTGGGVKIGAWSCVGAGSTLAHRVNIGDHTLVGAGSTVLGDIPARVLAFGTPAAIYRSREIGERHF